MTADDLRMVAYVLWGVSMLLALVILGHSMRQIYVLGRVQEKDGKQRQRLY